MGHKGDRAPQLPVPGGIRTPNLLIRSQLLYPVELQTHFLNALDRFMEPGRSCKLCPAF